MSIMTLEQAQEIVHIGMTIDNGATLVAFAFDDRADFDYAPGGVCLAIYGKEYVTWGFGVVRGAVLCSNGHYFSDLQSAVKDYYQRIPCQDCGLTYGHTYNCQTEWV